MIYNRTLFTRAGQLTDEEILFVARGPEETLWFRVLNFGIRDALKGDEKAKRWLNDNAASKKEMVGAVLWICEALDVWYLDEIRRIVNEGTVEEKKRLKTWLT